MANNPNSPSKSSRRHAAEQFGLGPDVVVLREASSERTPR